MYLIKYLSIYLSIYPKFYNFLNAKMTKSSTCATFKKSLKNFFSKGVINIAFLFIVTFIFVKGCTTFAGPYYHIRLAFLSSEEGFLTNCFL